MKIEVSNGEIADKFSILLIKSERIKNNVKLSNVQKELQTLRPVFESIVDFHHPLFVSLKRINEQLWDIEDAIRHKEKKQEFDSQFIGLARSVYIMNDQRAHLKKEIDAITGSDLSEEKSYSDY